MTWTCPATFDGPASPPGGHLTIDTSGGALPAVSLADAVGLLDRLLAMHWLGGVTDAQAARLAGMRRAEFVELSELRLAVRTIERVGWAYYQAQFLYRFPECDKRATKRDNGPLWDRDGRMFTDAELLTPPHVIGTDFRAVPRKIEDGKPVSPQATRPRALPRDNGQQQIPEAA